MRDASEIKVLNVQVERDYLGKSGEPSKRSMGSPKKVVEAFRKLLHTLEIWSLNGCSCFEH
jgi:hypothetical protein